MDDPCSLSGFNGKARLFPLPNLVFFPHVMQPLHIFEPRYREMTTDALAGDRLIALVLPQPGWEKDYADKPALHPIACLGRVMAEQALDDGRFNILLRGLKRIRIIKEIAGKKLYRTAKVEVLDDTPIDDNGRCDHWRRILLEKSPAWFANQDELIGQFRKLLDSNLGMGPLCDIMTFALPLDAEFKQTLLEELQVEARLQMLHEFMAAKATLAGVLQRKFPPEFSIN
jgi:Lon protease-like protein